MSPTENTDTQEKKKKFTTRDQDRAVYAYTQVAKITKKEEQAEYKIAVNQLGAQVMRSGLAAAMAFLERKNDREAVNRLLGDIAGANIMGLAGTNAKNLPDHIRKMDLESYMIATREILRILIWFRRAVQATF